MGLLALAGARRRAAAADFCLSAKGASGIPALPASRMPHLNGIVIAEGRRQALFRMPDEWSIAVVSEGASVASLMTVSIPAEWSTGHHTLRATLAASSLARFSRAVDQLRQLDPGMSLRSVSILLMVAQEPGVPQTTLIHRTGMDVSKSALSRIFQKLSKRPHPTEPYSLELITMDAAPDDLRFKLSKLTPKGELVVSALQQIMGE